jgi:hypothetical protein
MKTRLQLVATAMSEGWTRGERTAYSDEFTREQAPADYVVRAKAAGHINWTPVERIFVEYDSRGGVTHAYYQDQSVQSVLTGKHCGIVKEASPKDKKAQVLAWVMGQHG